MLTTSAAFRNSAAPCGWASTPRQLRQPAIRLDSVPNGNIGRPATRLPVKTSPWTMSRGRISRRARRWPQGTDDAGRALLGECQQLQRRKLLVECVPVLHREGDIVVPAHMQNRNACGPESGQHGIGRKHGIAWSGSRCCRRALSARRFANVADPVKVENLGSASRISHSTELTRRRTTRVRWHASTQIRLDFMSELL